MRVWNSFKSVCEESNKETVSYTKFNELWKQFHPSPSDLCFTCQQNTSKLLRAANLPEEEKSECVQAKQAHLNLVHMERELYRNVCDEATSYFKAIEDQIDIDERHKACSLRNTMHYSFDFAQQVHIPSNPMQPGPIYFKTPRKCSTAGVMCEAIPRQVNYLVDEASDVGKGANTTIIYVHHFFKHHGLGLGQSQVVENSDESQEVIGLLCQQLAKRTEECHDLRLRLENIEAVTTRILGNQKEMKDHFVKTFAVLVNSVFQPFYKVFLLNMHVTEYLVLLSEAECHLLS